MADFDPFQRGGIKDLDVTEKEFQGMTQKRTPSSTGPGTKAAKRTQLVDAIPAKNKYNAKKSVVDGQTFDSQKEAVRWVELKARLLCGEIRELTRQVRLPLEIEAFRICVYVCDFRYQQRGPEGEWLTIYEDTKGMRTPVYLLKKKLVKALLKIDILET